jgi:shikimate dehydrogenase
MRIFGLIGFPLTHSFSKSYFSNKFALENIQDAQYQNFELSEIELIREVLIDKNLCGLNVTIPYKQAVIPYLDSLDVAAKEIGAVNTIKRVNSKFVGYNTDYVGFEQSLKEKLQPYHTHALVLGSGGAAKAVQYVLKKNNIDFLNISRKESIDTITYNQITPQIFKKYSLIINTTPLGMYPNIDSCPNLPYHLITPQHYLYDLVYNPEETMFLNYGKKFGAKTKNGLDMLQLQAEEAWKIWNKNI